MLFKAAVVLAALLTPTFVSANDETLQFQIEGELAYLKLGYGITSVDVNAVGVRTEVIVGVDTFIANFSDVMWDTAARASLISPAPVLLVAVEKHSSFATGGKKLCYLRARKGQVFEGTC
ncbi:hypothetical protein [Mesorhizobium sp. M0006]|uniref:hypothetical protein n=1 Tax=Mesorhizobium sp. M0006 TaxID=2956838 RepID=UPI00333D4D23